MIKRVATVFILLWGVHFFSPFSFCFHGHGAEMLFQGIESGNTYSLAWGDYDNDGDSDLAVGNWGDNYLYINNGDGTFTEQRQFPDSGTSRNTNVVIWGHFNEGTNLDLAVGNHFGPNAVYINNGDGTFVEQLFLTGGGDTWSLAAEDYDNDGDSDLAVGNWGNNYFCINNGNGTFVEVEEFGSGETCELAWGDYDNDGDSDLAVGNFYASNVLYINNGDGTFTETEEFGSRYTRSIRWEDHDKDGDLDLAVGNQVQNALYINNGDSTFTELLEFGIGDTWCVRWGDWNNDTYPDLAVGNDIAQEPGRESFIYINNEGNTFTPLLIGDDHMYAVAWGDYDSDFDEDVAVGIYGGQNYIFENSEMTFDMMDSLFVEKLFVENTFFVAGDNAYCTDVLGSAKIAFGLASGGVPENPEGRTDAILADTEHDTGNLIPVGGPGINPVADEFDGYFGITYTYDPGATPPVFEISAEGYFISLNLDNYPSEDICIVYLRQHGLRAILLVWGYGWRGTYAGSLYVGDPANWVGNHLVLLRWTDSNSDGLVQEEEITVEVVR